MCSIRTFEERLDAAHDFLNPFARKGAMAIRLVAADVGCKKKENLRDDVLRRRSGGSAVRLDRVRVHDDDCWRPVMIASKTANFYLFRCYFTESRRFPITQKRTEYSVPHTNSRRMPRSVWSCSYRRRITCTIVVIILLLLLLLLTVV